MFKIIIKFIQQLLGLGSDSKPTIAPQEKKKEELKLVVKEQDKKIEEIKTSTISDEELKRMFNGDKLQ